MERNEQLLKFKEIVLDSVSPSVCSAKWLEATMWLYDGVTASCHHNPTHKIKLDPKDPSSLHNTPQKINERKDMLEGIRPPGCSYCWNAEDNNVISDRYRKSHSHKSHMLDIPLVLENDNVLSKASKKYIDTVFSDIHNVNPKILEIAFSRVCNLGCMYCGPYFSNTWANDIRVNGPYEIRPADHYDDRFENWLPEIKDEEDNPYIKAFFEWWPSLKKDLRTLRFTGGEPFLHKAMWKFLNEAVSDPLFLGNIMINSNLIHNKKIIEKFIDIAKTQKYINLKNGELTERKFEIHTSCESSLTDAEYIRDGFDGKQWLDNVNLLLASLPNLQITVTTAINNIGVWTYNEYVDIIIDLRKKYGKDRINLNSNRVFHPTYQSISLIDQENRNNLKMLISESRKKLSDSGLGNKYDYDQLDGLIHYLGELHIYSNSDEEEQALIKFLEVYNNRRDKDESTLSPGFKQWISTLRKKHVL